jgi:hypothetical protein
MKYQLTIVAESLQELQGVIDRLEPSPVAVTAQPEPVTLAEVVQAAAPAPIAALFAAPAPIVDDEEDDEPAVFAAPAPNVPPATSVAAAPLPVAAPVVPAASPTPAGAAEELDPRGFPWDERIHSSSRGRLAKGNFWKNRKNLPEGVIEQVEAELRAKGYGVPQTGASVAPMAPAPALPGAPALPTAVAPAPVANSGAVRVKELMTMGLAAGVWKAPELSKMIKAMGLEQLQDLLKYQGDFPSVIAAVELTSRLITLLTSGRVDQAWINQVLAYYTVPDVYSLTGSLDKCAAIKEYLDTSGL